MEESNLINNDNTYNTDMSTSLSAIGGNATTNNKFNKDDLLEVTGGGAGGIVTQSTAIVYGTETSLTTGNFILLILGDGTNTPDVDEDITYNAVINSEYKDRVPTIKLDGSEVSYCDANYVIAVTETDETIPVIYDSQNLSKTFTNNGDNWCRVTFKKPLEVKDQLKLPLNSDNFPDNSKIIVPVISCDENNTGQERNTTITFNIKNFAISHNIQLNVILLNYKKELLIGDVLYSTNDNKLTLDALTNGANNTPIAICVIPDVYENLKNGDDSDGGVHTARFVSLNYMNCDTPTTGSDSTQRMYFGNYGTTIGNVKGGTNRTSYIGGKWNTQRCVFKATNQDKTSDKVYNIPNEGYCAPACCCVRYSTPGTKQGDWYLPMPGELYQIYANKTIINEKRTAIKGSGFSESYYYWSSREFSSEGECCVDLNGISLNRDYGKDNGYYVLGFLAVEVPSFNIPSFKPSVNMEPVKLDALSSKKTPAVADVLYSTADGKLTLDAQTNSVDNTPIAICVIPEVMENFKNGDDSAGAVKTARFVSLNYMNYNTPTTGNKDTQYMYFGNNGVTVGNVKGRTDKTSYIGGKWNTQLCLSKATNQDKTGGKIENKSDAGYCAPACCCVAYSTPGTKSGDWYLPMPGELYQIYANKVAINEKRTALVGSGFSESRSYWSSREYSSYYEYYVFLNNGIVSYGSLKNYDNYVLGFLALEVPSFNIPSFKPSVNMEPVKLDSSSSKRKPEVGDVLYSTNDNKLTLDKTTNGVTNTAIAICVIKEVMENFKNGDESEGGVHTARFVSLNYMNYTTPATGSEEAQSMYFGNYQFTIGNTRGGTTKDSLVGGKWNTQLCLSKATNQDKTSDKVDNNSGIGYCAPACCCDRYSTPGTKSGDWYLPMPGELYELYANKTVINEKRTYIKGSGFIESTQYWSSRESSSSDEYAVYLGNGKVASHYKNNFDFYVLGFLAVEV